MTEVTEYTPVTIPKHDMRSIKRHDVANPWNQLKQLEPLITEARRDPEQFWSTRKAEVFQGFSSFLNTNQGKPDVEITIPVHHNGKDLPILLYTLSKQTDLEGKSATLTVALHNADEQSKAIAQELKAAVPDGVRLIELDSTMLTGAYAGWQFASGASIGKNVLLIDADSVATPQWSSKMVQDLDTHPDAVAAIGVRGFHEGSKLVKASKKASLFYNKATSQVTHTDEFSFVGGNSAVRGDILRSIIDTKLAGSLGGDAALEQILIQEYGRGSIDRIDNPILNSGAKYDDKDMKFWARLIAKSMIGRTGLRHIEPVYEVGAKIAIAKDIGTYNPWARNIINAWTEGKVSTREQIGQMLETEALIGGYRNNPNVNLVLDKLRKSNPNAKLTRSHDLYLALQEVATTVFKPAMTDAINKYRH